MSLGLSLAHASAEVDNENSWEARPNILFCILDDASYPHFGAYGCTWVDTPAFDRVAREGLLFQNAYTPNAKCAPSRSSILTGRNSWQLEEAANHVVNFPATFKTFPEALRDAGYATGKTGKGWGPGNPGEVDGKVRKLIGESYNKLNLEAAPSHGISGKDYAANFESFLDALGEGTPWFFWFGAHEPHRKYEYGSGRHRGGKSLEAIETVPRFWPDNDKVRNDMLDYAFEIEHADRHLGLMLEALERRGLLENTVVLVTSDNGMPFPRAKAQKYEYSIHMPLAVMWPQGIPSSGRRIEDYVSFIDFAPTFLELAGIPFENSGMSPSPGRSLTDIFASERSGQVNPDRNYVLIGKERHDYSRPQNQGYPVRGIVSDGHLFLRNYAIDRWPAGNPELGYLDVDGSPTKTTILELFRSQVDRSYWTLSFGKRKVEEELYDVRLDPECLLNLQGEASFDALRQGLRERMESLLREQGDPRMFGEGEVFDSYGYSEEKAWNFYERFMEGEFGSEDTGWVSPSDYEIAPLD
ncbi:sulfatase [Pelagicoccus sp. NFK12]|uniref:Sulfatase n=1 Tax=Pelagicoccus enzymogenes TaxID=2773457 RepID=A0A927F650_9BACT|nr:sulfatase [Pelagicoccus enzymogenes]